MYKDDQIEFLDLTTTEVAVELRAELSEMEDMLLDGGMFSNYMNLRRCSAMKIAFDHYREMMLEEINGTKI